jgi:hypothetical protein
MYQLYDYERIKEKYGGDKPGVDPYAQKGLM